LTSTTGTSTRDFRYVPFEPAATTTSGRCEPEAASIACTASS